MLSTLDLMSKVGSVEHLCKQPQRIIGVQCPLPQCLWAYRYNTDDIRRRHILTGPRNWEGEYYPELAQVLELLKKCLNLKCHVKGT